MPETPKKCAIVVADHLPTGLAVNAASVLAVTLGARVDGLVGKDVEDSDGVSHPGVIYTPLPVLTSPAHQISKMLGLAASDAELFFATFSSLAQSCKTYDEYIDRMAAVGTADIEVVGLVMFGPKRTVNRLVGSLPLLR